MIGYESYLECKECGIKYQLKEDGQLQCINGETLYNSIPNWYKYQREEVKKEIDNNSYLLDTKVDVIVMKDTYSLYLNHVALQQKLTQHCQTTTLKMLFKMV